MQTLQSVNDTMNIIFDPSVEGLSLLDFVLVEEDDRKFLGQVIEIKNDKYELNKNVAVLKILYSINAFDEIVEYRGYTPTRDAHIELYNQKEIEEFLNEGKTKFNAGLNPKTMLPLDFNLEFFKNSPVILADKLDELSTFYLNISDKISDFSNVIIFDYTGNLFVENSMRLRAGIDFKLPLNYDTLSYIWDIALSTASLNTQAVCEEIFNEVKLYSKTAENSFIPFDNFLNVIESQYNQTPIVELRVLKNRLNKYQQSKIFAQKKEDLEIIPKVSMREKITVLDFSMTDSIWQRAFIEHIFSNIQDGSFVLLRLNENNCNQKLIEKIYDKNSKLNIIPSFSYGFRRLVNVLEYAKNFVFLPTLNTSHNFSYANNTISTLTKNYASFFGEDTKGLIFKIQNRPVEINRYETEEKKALKKIKLKGLNKYSNEVKEEEVSNYVFDKDDEIANEVLNKKEEDIFAKYNKEKPLEEKEDDSLISIMEELHNENTQEVNYIQEIGAAPDQKEEIEPAEDIKEESEPEEPEIVQEPEIAQEPEIENTVTEPEPVASSKEEQEETPVDEKIIDENELDLFDKIINEPEENGFVEIDYEENKKEIENIEENQNSEEIPQENFEEENDIFFKEEPKEETLIEIPDEIAPRARENQENIIQDISKPQNSKIEINEDLTLDLSQIQNELEEPEKKESEDIPVFEEEENTTKTYGNFSEGDLIKHEKYGSGRIIKVINYSNRCLLQVEFEEHGKRLLDPKIANLTLIKEN